MKITTILNIAFVCCFLATISVTIVYAASIIIYSPTYTYTLSVSSIVENSVDGSGWNTIDQTGTGPNWFQRLTTTAIGYSGPGTVYWQLQRSTDGGSNWIDVGSAISTVVTFNGQSGQNIYATSNGEVSGNKNWFENFSSIAGKYRVQVTVSY